MDESKQLRNIVKWRTRQKPNRATKLSDILGKLMENRLSPQQARFELVAKLWNQLLPAELRRHCKIADISGGQLKVQADSPSHMCELRLCSSELLKELQRQCPRARIKKIKIVIG